MVSLMASMISRPVAWEPTVQPPNSRGSPPPGLFSVSGEYSRFFSSFDAIFEESEQVRCKLPGLFFVRHPELVFHRDARPCGADAHIRSGDQLHLGDDVSGVAAVIREMDARRGCFA